MTLTGVVATPPTRRRPVKRVISDEEYEADEEPTPAPTSRMTRSKVAKASQVVEEPSVVAPAGEEDYEENPRRASEPHASQQSGEETDDAVVANDDVEPARPAVQNADADREESHDGKADDVSDEADGTEAPLTQPLSSGSPKNPRRPAKTTTQEDHEEDRIDVSEPPQKKHRRNTDGQEPTLESESPPALADSKRKNSSDLEAPAVPEVRKESESQFGVEGSDRGRGESSADRRLTIMEDQVSDMFRFLKGLDKKLDDVKELKSSVHSLHERVENISQGGNVVAENVASSTTPRKRVGRRKEVKKNNRRQSKKECPSDTASQDVGPGIVSESDGGYDEPRPGAAVGPDSEDDENDQRPKAVFMRKMIAQVPHVKIAFSYDNLYPCYLRCMMAQLVDMINSEKVEGGENFMRLSPAGLADYLEIIGYSRKANEKKSVYHSGLGPTFMDLKLRVLCLCLLRGQKNAFGNFSLPVDAEKPNQAKGNEVPDNNVGSAAAKGEGMSGQQEDPKDGTKEGEPGSHVQDDKKTQPQTEVDDRPTLPFWLDMVDGQLFMTQAHIQEALRVAHTTGAGTDMYQKKVDIAADDAEPDQDDIGRFAATIAERRLKKYLHASRKCVGVGFLCTLGFPYACWANASKVKSDQSTLEMEWLTAIDFNPYPGRDEIPDMMTFKEKDAFENNSKMYDKFAKSRHELIVIVTHEGLTRPPGFVTKKRSRTGTVKNILPRPVNLLDVVLQVLHVASFAALSGDRKYVLSGHKDSLAAAYAAAIALRKVLSSHKERKISNTAGLNTPDEAVEQTIVDRVMDCLSATKSQEDKHLHRVIDSVMHKDFVAMKTATEKWRAHMQKKLEAASENGKQAAANPAADPEVVAEAARKEVMSKKLSEVDW